MKTKLLKFALCAMALMPMGAWGEAKLIDINFAELAVNKLNLSGQISVSRNTSTPYSINNTNTYPYSCEYFYENDILSASRDLFLRFNTEANIGLYQSNQTTYGFRDLQTNDVIEIAFKAKDSDSNPEITTYNCTEKSTTVDGYTLNFDGGAKTLKYTVTQYTVTDNGSASLTVQGAYFAYMKVTRPSSNVTSTVCTLNEKTFVAGGKNPDTTFPTSTPYVNTGSWSNSNTFNFTLTGASATDYVRDYNNSSYKINDVQTILLNKGTNGVFNITKSNNIKSITIYAKTSDNNSSAESIIANYGLTGQTPIITGLNNRSGDAKSADITNYLNISIPRSVLVVFSIEYYNKATLSVPDIEWASMYLPFEVFIPYGAKVYYAKATTSSAVTLTEITTRIPANTGVVVKGESGFYDFNFTSTEPDALGHTNLLEGVTTDTPFTDSEIYVLAGSENEKANPIFKLYDSGNSSGVTLSAYKSYLPASNVSTGSRTIKFGFDDDETTGITDVKINTENGTTQYYDLSGRRVTHPTKGLYIVNGKKVIIK